MSVHKDKERGTWFAQVQLRDPLTGKLITKKKRGFELKREAQAWEAEIRANNQEVQSSATFGVMMEEYLKSRTSANEETKRSKYHLAKTYATVFMDMPLNQIKPKDVLKWRNELAEKKLATRTKNNVISFVRSVSAFGYKYYNTPDFAKIIEPFRATAADKKEMQTWTIEEFNLFASYVKNYTIRAYFTFLFYTGCRRSEGKAVLKSDIKDGWVTIDKTIKHNKQGVRAPKTASSVRKIKLDKYTLEILKPLLAKDGPYLFGDFEPLGITTIQRSFDKAIAAANADGHPLKKIRIHDLRHSHATILINNGVNIVAVSKRLGHSDINMTLKVYTHLLEKNADELVDKLEELKESVA